MNRKPNIVFFFTDQQRWDTIGAYGQRLNVTPNLDEMARRGVLFTHAFTCQPVCGPARACLQTGKYATETGCYRNDIALPVNEKTLAHYLSEAGYEVGYIGKWHLASGGITINHSAAETSDDMADNYQTRAIPPERRGGYRDFWLAADILEFTSHGYDGYLFDQHMRKVRFRGYRVDCLTDFALDYLHTRRGDRPFFLFLSYIEPHHQNDHNRYEGPRGSQERFKEFSVPGDLANQEGDWQDQFPDYLGCCAGLDYNMERIRTELEKLKLIDNTLIIYASDHGSHFRTRNRHLEDGNYDDYKRSCHEASIHIPLIVYGPGFNEGKVINELVSLIDLPPTILAPAGIEKPETMHGRPLQELAHGIAENWPEEVFLQISESQVGRAIRTKKWKYSVRAPGVSGVRFADSDSYIEDFLYDLETDPHEQINLIKDPGYAEIRKQLEGILKRRIVEAEEQTPAILPNSDS